MLRTTQICEKSIIGTIDPLVRRY